MIDLNIALGDLRTALTRTESGSWRGQVRRGLAEVRDALNTATARPGEAWLAPRERSANRDRVRLQARVTALTTNLLDSFDTDLVRGEVRRLCADLERYIQRSHDLVYDAVSVEFGGSE